MSNRGLGGHRCMLVATGAAALLLAAPSGAGAQLPEVHAPLPNGTVGEVLPGDTVERAVSEPLAQPVEQVVQASPVAPVRDEVRRLAGRPSGGAASPGSSAAPALPADAPPGAGRTPSGTDRAQSGRGRPRSGPRAGSDDASPRSSDRGRPAPRGDPADARSAGDQLADAPSGAADGSAADRSERRAGSGGAAEAVIRTIERLVGVVPTLVWIALAVLALVAVALGGRTLVERRRMKAVEHERLELAREVSLLERALLPPVPARVGGLVASVAYRPCDGPAAGGDFYDAFEMADGRAVVIVGDVCGHGPAALEGTNSLRLALRGCLERGVAPRASLEWVNESGAALPDGTYATALVAVYDPAEGVLTYASAGHPPPVLVGSSVHEPMTVAGSPPIGLGFRTGLRQSSVALEAGTTVCLFTDGVPEARIGGELFGCDRLAALVAGAADDERAGALLERIAAEVDEAPDDMALCVLRADTVRGGAPTRAEELELEPDELAGDLAERFLVACGVNPESRAAALEQLAVVATSAGSASVSVTMVGDERHVSVARAERADRAAPV